LLKATVMFFLLDETNDESDGLKKKVDYFAV